METLHLFSQAVGKVRLARTPWLNHSWQVTLYVSARGMTTSLIPAGEVGFELEFDFVAHALVARSSKGEERRIAFSNQSVASFYAALMGALGELGVTTEIDALPNEMPDPIAFPADGAPRVYDPAPLKPSGARWCRSTGSSPASARPSSASAARCICSGAASTWR